MAGNNEQIGIIVNNPEYLKKLLLVAKLDEYEVKSLPSL